MRPEQTVKGDSDAAQHSGQFTHRMQKEELPLVKHNSIFKRTSTMDIGIKARCAFVLAMTGIAYSSPSLAFTQNVTLGESFLHAQATQHDGTYSPSLAIDGSYTGKSRWQAKSDNAITLDVGTVVDMKGVYVWLLASSSRNHWIRVESSQDGENWVSHWHAVATPKNANSKPVFLPLVTDNKNARYIRITGFGNSTNTRNYVTEVRWLSPDDEVSTNRHIKQAHWYNDRPELNGTGIVPKYFPPQLTSWSDGPTNLLSATSLNTSFIDCPLNGLSIFNPQYVVSDMTGHMSQFLTSKHLPDGSRVWVMDWNYVDLSKPEDWNGDVGYLNFPPEMFTVYEQWQSLYQELGTTEPISRFGDQCGIDVYGLGASFSNRPAFAHYLGNIENGSYQTEITEGWNEPVAVNQDAPNNFVESVNIGVPFVTQNIDSIGEGPSKATDGYIDSGSRWSADTSAGWPSIPNWTFTTGPSVTDNPKAHGLYLWMHRSDERWSKVNIEARADGQAWIPLTQELTLPSVPKTTPIYIPLPLGDTLNFKHFRLTGLGSQGTNWTSVAEFRYSQTDEPHPSAVVVQTSQIDPHPVKGNRFSKATSQVSLQTPQTNSPSFTIDGSIHGLNYWAVQGASTLYLETELPQVISAINLWMHRSSERSSIIGVHVDDSANTYVSQFFTDVDIPQSANNEPTRITFDPPVLSNSVTLKFDGNSNNDWNSISEVSWE